MMRGSLVFTVLLAGVSALVGLVVAEAANWGTSVSGIGWGMCIGGALAGVVIGGSGSPSTRLVGARASQVFWFGESAPLPQSPLWLLADALVVVAAGIAVVVLG